MPDKGTTRKPFYPSKAVAYIFAFVCAAFVANSSASFALSPGGFMGNFVIQMLLTVAIPAGVAFSLSGKGKSPARFGWIFLAGTTIMTTLAYAIAHQS